MHPPLDPPEEERTLRFDPATLPVFETPAEPPVEAAEPAPPEEYPDTVNEAVESVESLSDEAPAPEAQEVPVASEEYPLAGGEVFESVELLPDEAPAPEAQEVPVATEEPVPDSQEDSSVPVEESVPLETPEGGETLDPEAGGQPIEAAPVEEAAEPVALAEETPAEPAPEPEPPPAGEPAEVAAAESTRLEEDQATWGEIVRRDVGIPAENIPTRVAYLETWEEIVHRTGAAGLADAPRLDEVPLGIPVDLPAPVEPPPLPEPPPPATPEQEAWGEIVRREPGLASDAVRPLAPVDLATSPAYVEMGSRLGQSAEIVDRYSPDRLRFLARDLTAVLEGSLASGKLDGMMVATDDGLVIAESHRMDRGEVLAAISTLCESIATRLQRESLIERIEEMSIRGEHGEQIIVRYFPGLDRRYFLLGFSRRHVPYRRAMSTTVRACAELLDHHFPGPRPADKPNPEEST